MHYLIDGYNLLFRVWKKRGAEEGAGLLEKTRRALIEELNDTISQIGFQVTLIFDGSKDSLPPTLRSHFKSIALVYTTDGQSADDYIFEEVGLAKNPGDVTVVTNDRDLQAKCRGVRTHCLSIDAFLTRLDKNKKKQTVKPNRQTFRESERELKRLLAIFERRLENDSP